MTATLVAAYALTIISAVQALPGGAPITSCGTIAPDPSGSGHQGASRPIASSPFTLNVTSLSGGYVAGTRYNLVLTGGVTQYEGLLVQARLASDLITPAGTFTALATTTQIAPCTPTGSAITQTSKSQKNNLALQWTAPPAGTGSVIFLYTVVISLSNYYATQFTAPIVELGGGTTSAPNVGTTNPPSGTAASFTLNSWSVSAIAIVAVIGSMIALVFVSVNIVSLAFYLHKLVG